MSLYTTGTATFTSGSPNVTGSGTAWSAAMVGASIGRPGIGVIGHIVAVNSATSITLAFNVAAGQAGSGVAYWIDLNTSDAAKDEAIRASVATMLQTLSSVQGAPMAALVASSTFSRGLLDNPDAAAWRADLDINATGDARYVRYDAAQTLSNTQASNAWANLHMVTGDAEWLNLVNASLPSRLGSHLFAGAIGGGVSLNTVTNTGRYGVEPAVTADRPINNWGLLDVLFGSPQLGVQLFREFTSGPTSRAWRRFAMAGGTWTAWELLHEGQAALDARYMRPDSNATISAVYKSNQPFSGGIATQAGSPAGYEPVNTGGGAAILSFHRAGLFAAYIGLDTDNQFKVGGWSMGAVAHALHHDGRASRFPSFTVATVPSASTSGAGAIIYVSNESGGATIAFSDGTNWRRVADRAVIS